MTYERDEERDEELTAQVHMVYENAPAAKSRLEETGKDLGLKKVTYYIIEGWPNNKDNILNEAKSYWPFREELSIINRIVFKRERLLIPEVMRSDNGPQYSSSSFKKFSKDWIFQHTTSSSEYPRSNVLAEKTVQTEKCLLEKAKDDNKDQHLTMSEARKTPVDNYRSPAELAVGRRLRSVLPANPNNLKIKTMDGDEFKERRRKQVL